MKKLITMIGAAAAALGLYADAFTFTGSNFEQAGWSAGDSVIGVADDGTAGASFWTQGEDAESTAKIAAEDTGKGDLIGEWKDSGSTKVVDIKTKLDKPVFRNVLTTGAGVAMSDCVFFDSLVKFTACDEPVDVSSFEGAKLAVWIHEDEENQKTNLFVTAGYFTDAGNTTVVTNYDCGGISSYDIVPGEWCRLTIKTIADITNEDGVPGFAIFVNGNDGNATPVACTESKGVAGSAITKLNNACAARGVKYIFPSIDQESVDKAEVAGVGFAGQGSVDEVTFTASEDSRAFAADPEIQMFTINWADGDITALAINDEPVDIGGKLSYSYPLIGVTELTVTPTFATGKKMVYDWNGATDCEASYANGTITVTDFVAEGQPAIMIETMSSANGATVNGRTYPTIAEAVEYLNGLSGEQTLVIGDAVSATASTDNNVFIEDTCGVTTLTIDLAGQTIMGAYYEVSAGVAGGVIEIDSNTDVTIVDNVGGGKVVADTDQPAVYAYAGELTIVDGTYDGEVVIDSEGGTADGALIGGKYLASANTDEDDKFTLNDYVDPESYEAKLVDEGAYWEVAEITTFAVEVAAPESGSHVTLSSITVDGVAVQTPAAGKYDAETSVEVVYALDTGYQLATGSAPLTQSFTAAGSTIVPTAEAATYDITYEFTGVEEADKVNIVNSNPATYTFGVGVDSFADASCEGYKFTGWDTTSIGTEESGAKTITGTFEKQGGWDPVADPKVTAGSKGITGDLAVVSFKTLSIWAQANGVTFAAGNMDAYKNAFLLNCAPAAAADEAAAFKITAITQKDDGSWEVTAVEENTDGNAYNGQVVIKGSETLEDAEWDASNVEGPFFKAFLEVLPAPVAD